MQGGREVIVKNGDGRQTWSSNSDGETQQLEKLYGHRSGGTKALVRAGGTSSGNEGQEVDGEGSSRVYIQMPLLEIRMGVTTGR